MPTYAMRHRLGAEALGTFWLVFAGCGSAVLAAAFAAEDGFPLGIGFLGVALAFGLSVTDDGLRRRSRLRRPLQPRRHARAGGVGTVPAGATCIAVRRRAGARRHRGRGRALGHRLRHRRLLAGQDAAASPANGYGDRSPGGYDLAAACLAEVVLTAFFLLVILGRHRHPRPRRASRRSRSGCALTLIHLVSIPVTNTSVNPARSTGPAIFAGADALGQLWLFWLAPLVGGLIAGFAYTWLLGRDEVPPTSLEEATEA